MEDFKWDYAEAGTVCEFKLSDGNICLAPALILDVEAFDNNDFPAFFCEEHDPRKEETNGMD